MNDEISGTMFGKPFSIRGRDVFPWVLVGILAASCAWLVEFSVSKWGTPIDLAKTITQYNQIAADQHAEIKASVEARLDELTYVISITPEERAKLRLDMPDTLRQRIHKGDH